MSNPLGFLFDADRTGAAFSDCERYRYSLWRSRGDGPPLLCIGLNPSTADAMQDDPTIRRVIDFAKRWGHGKLFMGNLFAFRATDPKVMKAEPDPVGSENDSWLHRMHSESSMTLVAWGKHGSHLKRAEAVCQLLRGQLHCLDLNNDWTPRHPLYVPAATKPKPFLFHH